MSFKSFFKKLFSKDISYKFWGYVSVVYPIVELAAFYTPNKLDDEIIVLARQWGVQAILDGSRPKGEVIKDIAIQQAQRRLPQVPKDVVARAVEAAYQQLKASSSLQ